MEISEASIYLCLHDDSQRNVFILILLILLSPYYLTTHEYYIVYLLHFQYFLQTANATQWLLYALGKNKHVQNTLFEQLQAGDGDRLLKNVIKESMRLYPVATFITRYMPRDTTLSCYKLKAGVRVLTLHSESNCYCDKSNFFDAFV